jgi:hypothetical protein
MLTRLIEELKKHEGKLYDLEDCEVYGCPNCNDLDGLIQKEVLNSEILFIKKCSKCNNEFMVLRCDDDTKSLCTKHPSDS